MPTPTDWTEYPRPTGFEVYSWPEFKALCDRLGISHDRLTTEITIKLTVDDVVIIHGYRACDTLPEEANADPCHGAAGDGPGGQ